MNIELHTHTHTLASGHAYSTITEMIDAAVDKGLKLLAITEHAPAMPGSCKDFYFYNLKILPRFQKGLEIMFGVELNVMDYEGRLDLPERYGSADCQSPSALSETGNDGRKYGGSTGGYSQPLCGYSRSSRRRTVSAGL